MHGQSYVMTAHWPEPPSPKKRLKKKKKVGCCGPNIRLAHQLLSRFSQITCLGVYTVQPQTPCKFLFVKSVVVSL